MNKKILVIAAHPDDEILGCGGTIIKHIKKKDIVNVVFLSDGESSRKNDDLKISIRKKQAISCCKFLNTKKPYFFNFPDNKLDSIPLLHIIKKIENTIKKLKPEIIYTHYFGDLNIDHQKTFEAVNVACRPLKKNTVKNIFCFEILSSSEWQISTKKKFNPNYFINIDNEIKQKLSALKMYKNELKKYPHSRSLKGVNALSMYRGIQSGNKHAEAFYIARSIEK